MNLYAFFMIFLETILDERFGKMRGTGYICIGKEM